MSFLQSQAASGLEQIVRERAVKFLLLFEVRHAEEIHCFGQQSCEGLSHAW